MIAKGVSWCFAGKKRRRAVEERSESDSEVQLSSDDDYVLPPWDGEPASGSSDDGEWTAEEYSRRREKKRKGRARGGRDDAGPSSIPPASYDDGDDDDDRVPVVEDGGASSRKRASKKSKRKSKGNALIWEVLERENEIWIDERERMGDSGNPPDETGVAIQVADPSPDVTLPLLRFQKEWVAWALMQEASSARGGILADEMGMGKTIQAISLVLTARSLRMTHGEPHQSDIHGSSCVPPSAPVLPVAKCTLVICPLVAVIQWVGEIERYTKGGSVRVLVYHGAKRLNMNYNFNDYDFVLTTYSTIEGDFRRNVMPPKEKCQWCGRLLYPSKMKVHLKYFCGPSAQKTEKQSKQTKKGAEAPSLKKRQRDVHNNTRKDDASGLKAASSIMNSVLHSVRWDRIILDEASPL